MSLLILLSDENMSSIVVMRSTIIVTRSARIVSQSVDHKFDAQVSPLILLSDENMSLEELQAFLQVSMALSSYGSK